jgi:hypothetical protein
MIGGAYIFVRDDDYIRGSGDAKHGPRIEVGSISIYLRNAEDLARVEKALSDARAAWQAAVLDVAEIEAHAENIDGEAARASLRKARAAARREALGEGQIDLVGMTKQIVGVDRA